MSRPFVSVLTPTYNRRLFFPTAIECFKQQEYPSNRIEWLILDNGTDQIDDLIKASGLTNVRHIPITDRKVKIGELRNILNREAKGEICVCMDDDDYYPPDRIRDCVKVLLANQKKGIQVVGCSEVLLYYTDRQEIWRIGPYANTHCTNNTMAYFTEYGKNNFYDETVVMAEEKSYLKEFKTPMVQLETEKHLICICHSTNTFDKRNLLLQVNPKLVKTNLKINKIVKSKAIRDFYLTLKDETARTPIIVPEHIKKAQAEALAKSQVQSQQSSQPTPQDQQ
jgi:glycosyltransferase involved in cell wall biosynthesis